MSACRVVDVGRCFGRNGLHNDSARAHVDNSTIGDVNGRYGNHSKRNAKIDTPHAAPDWNPARHEVSKAVFYNGMDIRL